MPDRERPAGEVDPKGLGGLAGDGAAPDDIDGLGAQAPVDDRGQLVEVGVEHDPALLHEDRGVVVGRVEGEPRVIAAPADGITIRHQRSPSGNATVARPTRTEMRRRPGRTASEA